MQSWRKKPGRAPTSCAECRRLKLRCDRRVPCGSCVKRGCGTICPTGSLIGVRGDRLILTSNADLHDKIHMLSARVRELEGALRNAHEQISNNAHPLLSSTISVASQSGSDKSLSESSLQVSPSDASADSMISALGTLTIGIHGESTFMNSTARTEYLMGHSVHKSSVWGTLLQNSRLPSGVIKQCVFEHGFITVDDELRRIAMDYLPSVEEAVRLCEIYLKWGETLWYPISRQELLDDILVEVYRANSYEELGGSHCLALFYSILALATLFDFSQPPESVKAFDYHILSWSLLDISSPSTTATLHTMIVIEHNLRWAHIGSIQADPSRTYVLLGFGVNLAYRMGLHLHGARFKLDQDVVQKRCIVFWQLFLMDALLSFHVGRPPCFSLDWIDAPYPDDEFPVTNDTGETETSWHAWRWRYGRMLHEILVTAFGAKNPTYTTILELDRKIRDFPVPSRLQLHHVCHKQVGQQTVLQQILVLVGKEQVLLNIHRRYFTHALQDTPDDLLKHKYGPSVIATYRAAWRLISGLSSAVNWIPDVVARSSILWSMAFSAAIVMCMIVNYAPNSNMAVSALHEIDVVYKVFKKAAPTVKCASILLEYVERVWSKSRENFCSPQSDTISTSELDRVAGGMTSVISKADIISSPSDRLRANPPTSYLTSTDVDPPCIPNSFHLFSSSIHPRIMQDMQVFSGWQPSPTTVEFGYGTPEQFSRTMIDKQSDHFQVEPEMVNAQPEALDDFQVHEIPTSREAYLPDAYVPNGMYSSELDVAWKGFMEQLGIR